MLTHRHHVAYESSFAVSNESGQLDSTEALLTGVEYEPCTLVLLSVFEGVSGIHLLQVSWKMDLSPTPSSCNLLEIVWGSVTSIGFLKAPSAGEVPLAFAVSAGLLLASYTADAQELRLILAVHFPSMPELAMIYFWFGVPKNRLGLFEGAPR